MLKGRILRHGAEPHRVPRSRGLSFCTATAPPAQGPIRPNTDWVKKRAFEPAVLPAQPLACRLARTPLPNPGDLGTGVGTDPPAWDGAFLRRGCLAASGAIEPLCTPSAFPYLMLGGFFSSSASGPSCIRVASRWPGQEVLVWDRTHLRGHQEGQGVFGVTDSSAVLWGRNHR